MSRFNAFTENEQAVIEEALLRYDADAIMSDEFLGEAEQAIHLKAQKELVLELDTEETS